MVRGRDRVAHKDKGGGNSTNNARATSESGYGSGTGSRVGGKRRTLSASATPSVRFETPTHTPTPISSSSSIPTYAIVTPQHSNSTSSQSTYSEIHKRSSSVPAGKKTLSGGSKFVNSSSLKSESRRTKSLAEFAAEVCGDNLPIHVSTSNQSTRTLRGGADFGVVPITRIVSSRSRDSSPEEQSNICNSYDNRASSYSTLSSYDSTEKRNNAQRSNTDNSDNIVLKSSSPKPMSGGTLFPTSMTKSYSAELINKIQNQSLTVNSSVKVVYPESPVRDRPNNTEAENSFANVFSPRRSGSVPGSHILVGGGGRNRPTINTQQ